MWLIAKKKCALLLSILLFFFLNFRFYEVQKLEENMESYLAVTIDGNYTTSIPTKESGKAVINIIVDLMEHLDVLPVMEIHLD